MKILRNAFSLILVVGLISTACGGSDSDDGGAVQEIGSSSGSSSASGSSSGSGSSSTPATTAAPVASGSADDGLAGTSVTVLVLRVVMKSRVLCRMRWMLLLLSLGLRLPIRVIVMLLT